MTLAEAAATTARRSTRALVLAGSAGACLATAHTLWNTRMLRRPSAAPPASSERVCVLVPARDEAGTIGQCLAALRAQRGLASLHILVLDDASSDGTAQVVGHHVAADPRVQLLIGKGNPPPGWLGKPWACQRLSDQAVAEFGPSVLAFVDADVRLEPQALVASIDLLRTTRLDLVSPYPRQEAATPAERLVQPLLQWSWLTFLPLRVAERSRRPSLSAANGQLLVVDSTAYVRVGGHASVSDRVVEDVALMAALKRSGCRGAVVDGTRLASCRMYRDWPALRDGYSKSLWAAFGSTRGAALVAAALALLYVVPPVAALRGSRTGLVGFAAAVAGRAVVARRVDAHAWPDSIAHPVSIALLDLLVVRSLWFRRRGDLAWKGRPVVPVRHGSRQPGQDG